MLPALGLIKTSGRHTLLRLAGWALAFDVWIHLLLELFYGAAMPLRADLVHAAARWSGCRSSTGWSGCSSSFCGHGCHRQAGVLYLYALEVLGGRSKRRTVPPAGLISPVYLGGICCRGAVLRKIDLDTALLRSALTWGFVPLTLDWRWGRMSVLKRQALLIVRITLFLCGCGQALSEREMSAPYFARQQGQYLPRSAAG